MFRTLALSCLLTLSFSVHAQQADQVANQTPMDGDDGTIVTFKNCDEGNNHPGTTFRDHGVMKDVCYTTELHCTRRAEGDGNSVVEARWKDIKAYCRPDSGTHRCPSTTECANDTELDSSDAEKFVIPHHTGDDVCADGNSPSDSVVTEDRSTTARTPRASAPAAVPAGRSARSKQ